MIFSKSKILGLTAAVILAGTMPAAAQQDATMDYSGKAAQTGQQFSETKIDAYADSAMKISEIHSEMAPQIQSAQSDEQKNEMFTEMQEQMIGAVEDTENISVEEYNAISQSAQQNPQLASRIRSKVEEKAAQ